MSLQTKFCHVVFSSDIYHFEATMEGRKTNKITNCKQFEMLVGLMEKNIKIAKGYLCFGSSKDDFNNIWNGFTDQLNSIGPPVRTSTEWQKVWNDYKGKIKMKLGHNKKELTATGGGCNKLYSFSAQQENVIDILMLREVAQPARKTFGLNNSNYQQSTSQKNNNISSPIPSSSKQNDTVQDDAIYEYVDVDVEQNCLSTELDEIIPEPEPEKNHKPVPESSNKFKKRTSKKSFEDERRRLLELQTTSIMQTEKNSRETARYIRKLYELKSKKFKVYKENLLIERKIKKDKLELKLREIELKERELAMKERN